MRKNNGGLVVALGLLLLALVLLAVIFRADAREEYGRQVCEELAATGMTLWTQEQYVAWNEALVNAGQRATWVEQISSFDDAREARARLIEWQWWGYDAERFPPSVNPQPDQFVIWVYELEAGRYVVLPFQLGSMPHCQCVGVATQAQVDDLARRLGGT